MSRKTDNLDLGMGAALWLPHATVCSLSAPQQAVGCYLGFLVALAGLIIVQFSMSFDIFWGLMFLHFHLCQLQFAEGK